MSQTVEYNVLSCNAEESLKKFLDSVPEADCFQNSMVFLVQRYIFGKIFMNMWSVFYVNLRTHIPTDSGGAPGHMTWLEDPPPWLPALPIALLCFGNSVNRK